MKKNYTRCLITFLILCLPALLAAQLRIFEEGFENGLPSTWTQEPSTNERWNVVTGEMQMPPEKAFSGESRIQFYINDQSSKKARLVSPSIDTRNLRMPYVLKFHYAIPAIAGSHKNDTLLLLYRTSATAVWDTINTYSTSSYNWIEATEEIPQKFEYLQLAFEGISGEGRGIFLDEIVLEDVKVCIQITDLSASKITSDRATIEWGEAMFASYWVKVSPGPINPAVDDAPIERNITTPRRIDLTELSPNTKYYFYVKSNCGNGDEGEWSQAGTFTTMCAPVTELKENFESYTAGKNQPIGCWKAYLEKYNDVTNSDLPVVNSSAVNSTSGSQSVKFYSAHSVQGTSSKPFYGETQYTKDFLVSPEISSSVNLNNMQLSFNMKYDKLYSKVHVGISEFADNFDDMVELDAFQCANINSFENKILPLNNYDGNGRYIVFYTQGIDARASLTAYLDDIELQPLSTDCNSTRVTSTKAAVTSNSAIISWNDINASRWNLKVSTKPINPYLEYGDTFDSEVNSNTQLIPDLGVGMTYYYYVQTICEQGTGTWSEQKLFVTECSEEGISLPYIQYFDTEPTYSSGKHTAFPACWKRFSSYSYPGTYNPKINSTNYSAPGALEFPYRNNDWSIVVLPEIQAPLNTIQIRFMASASANNCSIIVAAVSDFDTGTAKPQNYDIIANVKLDGTTWKEYTVKFNGYQGTKKHLAFITPEEAGGTILYFRMDNLFIEKIKDCAMPENFKGTLSGNSVSLEWETTGNGNNFEIVYGTKGFSPDDPANILIPATGTIKSIDLPHNSNLDFYIRTVCTSDNKSFWSGPVNFITAQNPTNIPYETNFETGDDNDSWTFLNGTYPNQWRIGNATKYEGISSMYVSTINNDNGYANVASNIYAYRILNFGADGLYDINFMWKAMGEDAKDFMKVFLVPDTEEIKENDKNGITDKLNPAKWIPVGEIFYNEKEWNDVTFTHIIRKGKYKLVFYWTNDGGISSVNNPPAAAVDNVSVTVNTSCMTPVDIMVKEIHDYSAVLSFTAFNTPEWDLKVSTKDMSGNLSEQADTYDGKISSTSYLMDFLHANTKYYYYLKTPCEIEWKNSGSFTTKCEKKSLPLIENFDTYRTDTISYPDCWSKLTNNSGSSFPYIVTTNYNSPGALQLSQTSSTYCIAITPLLELNSLQDVQVEFMARSSSASHQLVIGAMSDPADYSTFKRLDTIKPLAANKWEYFEFPFDDYRGDAKYIAFLTENSTANFFIDSLIIRKTPACRNPREFHSTSISHNGAILKWRGYNMASFNVKVSTRPISPDTDEADIVNDIVNTNSLDLNGKLRYLCNYYWYVKPACSDQTDAKWSKEQHFETSCPLLYEVPVMENFDNYGSGSNVIPTCWTAVKSYGAYPQLYTTLASYTVTPPASLYFKGGAANYNLLALPELDVNRIQDLTISFKARIANAAYKLSVGIMTDIEDVNSFTPVKTIERIGSSSNFEDYRVDLSEYEGTGKHIAFRTNTDGSTATEVYVDNLVIQHTNISCAAPTRLKAHEITDTSAELRWNVSTGAPEYYNLKISSYPIQPSLEDGDIVNISSLEERKFKYSNFKALRTYYVYVQAVCDSENNDVSYWSNITFLTLCSPVPLPYEEDFSGYTIGSNQFPECWRSFYDITGNPKASDVKSICIFDGKLNGSPNPALRLEPYYVNTSSNKATTIARAITPLLEVDDLKNCQLSFRYQGSLTTRNYKFYVGLTSDWADESKLQIIDTIYLNGSNQWHNTYLINLSEYDINAKHVVFMASTDGKDSPSTFNVQIDNIVIDKIADCAPPHKIKSTLINSNSISMEWKSGNADSNEWKYIVSKENIDLSTEQGIILLENNIFKEGTAATNNCTVTDLSANTIYYFYIAAICGDKKAYYPRGYKVVTSCEPAKIPYVIDFENISGGSGAYSAFPDCWTRIFQGIGSGSAYPLVGSITVSSVKHNVLNVYANKDSANSWVLAATPELKVLKIQDHRARFKAIRTNTTTYKGKIYAGIMDDPNDVSTLSIIDSVEISDKDVFHNDIRIPFKDYKGNGKYFAFYGTSGNQIFIDDLNIEKNVDCDIPGKSKIIARTDSSFTVSWNKPEINASWEVAYGPKGFDINVNGYNTKVATDTFCIIKDLSPNTEYDVYVRTVCSEEKSSWTDKLTVSTFQKPAKIPYFNDFEAEDISNWTFINGKSVNKWHIGNAASTNEGMRSLYISGDEGATNTFQTNKSSDVFVYRRFELPTGTYDISFKWRAKGNQSNACLKVMLVPDSISINPDSNNGILASMVPGGKGFIELKDGTKVYLEGVSEWTDFNYTVQITEAIAGNYHMLFYWKNNSSGDDTRQPPAAVDSIEIKRMPCTTPQYIKISNITKNSATINWLSYNAQYWDVKISTIRIPLNEVGGKTADVLNTQVTEIPYKLPENTLQEGTKYYVYVKADCDESEWVEKPFMTVCPSVNSFPIVENFDHAVGIDAYMDCWTKLNNDPGRAQYNNNDHYPYITDKNTYGGSAGKLQFSSSKNYYSMAISPEFAGQDINKLHMSFMGRRNLSDSESFLIIGVISDPSSYDSFEPLDTVYPSSNVYEEFKISVKDYNYTGQARHIALLSPQESNTFYVDDLRIGCWEEHDMYDNKCVGYPYALKGFDIPAEKLTKPGPHIFTREGLKTGTATGCDSLITLHLNLFESSRDTIYASICKGEIYTENGFKTSKAGFQDRTITSDFSGCDSTIVLHLTINPTYEFTTTQKTCLASLPFKWSQTGKEYYEGGTYYDSLKTKFTDCDSVYILDLKVVTEEKEILNWEICQGDSIFFKKRYYKEQITVIDTLSSVNKCDSIVTLNLTVNQKYDINEYVQRCDGDVFTGFGFEKLTNSGTYSKGKTKSIVTGCDSTFTLHLTFSKKLYHSIVDTICEGESYNKHNFDIAVPIANHLYVKDTVSVVTECDSTVSLLLRIMLNVEGFDERNITESELPLTYNDTVFDIGTISDTYTLHYLTQHGCDSTVYLTLNIDRGSGIINLQENNFSLIPNPVNIGDNVYIHYEFTEEEKEGLQIKIFNNAGVRVTQFHPVQYPVNLKGYINKSGIYLIRVTTGNNKMLTGKLIVM